MSKQGRARMVGAGLVILALVAPGLASAQHVDSNPDRFLGPPRKVALVAYPLDMLIYAAAGAPQLAAEVWVELSDGLTLTIRPMGIWYPPTDTRDTHGGGVGGALGLYYFFQRSLSGPYIGFHGGDVEAFIGGERGRIAGGSAIFGYAIAWDEGAILSFGFGLGYWHRFGVLDTGVQWPEVLALRIGTGWGWGTGEKNVPRRADTDW